MLRNESVPAKIAVPPLSDVQHGAKCCCSAHADAILEIRASVARRPGPHGDDARRSGRINWRRIRDLLEAGTECLRVNCAHDGPAPGNRWSSTCAGPSAAGACAARWRSTWPGPSSAPAYPAGPGGGEAGPGRCAIRLDAPTELPPYGLLRRGWHEGDRDDGATIPVEGDLADEGEAGDAVVPPTTSRCKRRRALVEFMPANASARRKRPPTSCRGRACRCDAKGEMHDSAKSTVRALPTIEQWIVLRRVRHARLGARRNAGPRRGGTDQRLLGAGDRLRVLCRCRGKARYWCPRRRADPLPDDGKIPGMIRGAAAASSLCIETTRLPPRRGATRWRKGIHLLTGRPGD